MGSIPTHSRHSLFPVLLVASFLLGAFAEHGAAADASRPKPREEVSPFGSSCRSLLVPGWGQLANGSEKKAVVLFSLQTYLLGRVFATERRARYYQDRMNDTAPAWDREDLEARYHDLRGTRADLVWWSSLLVLYSVIDAYVDAHLAGFDEEVDEVERVTGGVAPAPGGIELGVRWTF